MLQNQAIKLVERGRDFYPREIMRTVPHISRGNISNREEFSNYTFMNTDVSVALFSDYQRREREYDMVFIDIDDAEIPVAFTKTMVAIDRLRDVGIKNFIILFSGAKGFHLYLPLRPVKLLNFREAVIGLLKKSRVWDFVDPMGVGMGKLTRVIGTKNSKTGNYCVSVGNDFTKTVNQMMQASVVNESEDFDIVMNEDVDAMLRQFDAQSATNKPDIRGLYSSCSTMFSEFDVYPPCMKRLITMALDSVDLDHEQRLEMAKFLMHVHGGEVDIVSEYYSKMSDYDPEITNRQLEYIKNRELKMMNCTNLDSVGICAVTDKSMCPFFPSLNSIIAKDLKSRT